MEASIVLFPRTVLDRNLLSLLIPWFETIKVMQPPALENGGDPPCSWVPDVLSGSALLQLITPPPAGSRGMAAQLREWEQWIAQQEGTGLVEAVKAGIKPPPPPETVRTVMNQIRDLDKPGQQEAGPPPGVRADLLLYLAHRRDRDAVEMAEIMARVERGQEELGRVMGLEEEDAPPPDYQTPFADLLPPVEYSLAPERQLEARLAAWADCAGRVELAGAYLAAAGLEPARLLLERANARFRDDPRSPAGAALPLSPGPGGDDGPLAREAARLLVPDLAGLEWEDILALRDASPGLRRDLAGLLARLEEREWSPEWGEELAGQARDLARDLARAVSRAGLEPRGRRGLSLLVFPGLAREHLLGLMKQELPPPEASGGSCPLLVAW